MGKLSLKLKKISLNEESRIMELGFIISLSSFLILYSITNYEQVRECFPHKGSVPCRNLPGTSCLIGQVKKLV